MEILNKCAAFLGRLTFDVQRLLGRHDNQIAPSEDYLKWLKPNGTRAEISKEIFPELERQLELDLKIYIPDVQGLKFDWSDAHSPEGLEHKRTINFGPARIVATIARTDDVSIQSADGKIVAIGSFDFVYSGSNDGDPFFAFWTDLSSQQGGDLVPAPFEDRIGKIPEHIWTKIPEKMKSTLLSDFDNHWRNDPKVLDAAKLT